MNGKPIFFYDNLLKEYTVTVTTENAAYPKGNLYDDDLNSLFKPTGSGDLTVRIDAGAAVPVDIFCLGRVHNLLTVSATVALQHSATGAWAGEESDAFTPFDPSTDNSYQHKLFTQVSARYWQVKFSGMSGIPQIGELAFGARYTLPKWFGDGFDDRKKKLKKIVNLSDGGQSETVNFNKRRVFPCRIRNIAVGTQAETDMFAWRDAVEEGMPFWMLWDLSGGAYEMALVTLPDDELEAPISSGMRRDFSFNLQEEL